MAKFLSQECQQLLLSAKNILSIAANTWGWNRIIKIKLRIKKRKAKNAWPLPELGLRPLHGFCILLLLTVSSPATTVCTTSWNIKKLYFPRNVFLCFIGLSHVPHTICNKHGVCSLCGKNWMITYYSDKPRRSKDYVYQPQSRLD